jgi:hypothetical protein
MKNKYNIPVVVDDLLLRKGNFIDHYKVRMGIIKYYIKRRNISKIEQLIVFGIELNIYEK